MSNLRTFQISEGINLHCLKDDKFTTNSVTFFIRTNLTNETAAKAALLARVLKSGCSEYPSVSLFNRHLQELYGCTMDIFTFKKDCRLVLCLNFVFANKAVLLPKVFFVAGNTLLSPKTFLNRFMEADFSNGVYAQSKAIRSLKDNKTQYAIFRLYEEMCRDAEADEVSRSFSISADGSLKELSLITPSTLHAFYNNLITSAPMDVYCVGPASGDEFKACFDKIPFFDMARKKYQPCGRLKGTNTQTRIVNESYSLTGLNQAVLCIGYTFSNGSVYACEVLNEILSDPSGLLFNTVRQKEGLCYSIFSSILPNTGVLSVCCQTDSKNINKACQIISDCIKNAASATPEQLKTAKDSLCAKYSLITDSQQETTGFLFSCRLNSIIPDTDEYIQNIKSVSQSEIDGIVSSIKEQVIYTLN